MKRIFLLSVFLIYVFSACSSNISNSTTSTQPPTITLTKEPTLSPTLTLLPTPIIYETIGSPFASDCGDGIPRIWSNDSFNGPARDVPSDEHHGHVDIFVPKGCDINNYKGEVIAPLSGNLIVGDIPGHPNVYLLYPDTFYINGLKEALMFIGISNPNISKVTEIRLNMGHFHSSINDIETGIYVKKGQKIGDVVPEGNHWKLAYQIYVISEGIDYAISPTLFNLDKQWPCVPGSRYDCVATKHDYIK